MLKNDDGSPSIFVFQVRDQLMIQAVWIGPALCNDSCTDVAEEPR